MTEERVEMLRQPRKFCTWMLNLAFAAILFAVLVKVMMLSQDVEDSRRMLKELSSNLSNIQRENEYLKKQLRNTKPKVENNVRKFSKAQKVSDVRKSAAKRDAGAQKKEKCRRNRIHSCLETYFKENPLNCSTIRHCMPPPERKKDLIQVHELKAVNISKELNKKTGLLTVVWRKYFPNTGNIVLWDKKRIKILRGGIYFVYCSLRVGSEYVEEVTISTNHSRNGEKTLFSTKINNTNGNHKVKLFGQDEILDGTDLYVQVKPRPDVIIPKNILAGLRSLFPGYSADNSMEYNYFGAFLVS